MKIGVGIQGWGKYSGTLWWLNPDIVLFMQDGLREIQWLRANSWKGEVWFRFYDGNSMTDTPEVYAARVHQWLVENDTGIDIRHVILWNELNLGVEHGNTTERWDTPEAYATINDWCLRCLRRFRELTGNTYIIHWGALSPGHDLGMPEGEFNVMKQSLDAADIIDIHVYGPTSDPWSGTGRAKRIVAKLNSLGIPTNKIAITETNQVIYVELCEWLKRELPDLSAVVWFLFCAEDPVHSAWDLIKQDLELLREFIIKNREANMVELNRENCIEQLPDLYNAWKAAGGIRNNFWKHVLAIKPEVGITADDVKMAVNEAEAATMQAKLILAKYPFP